MKYQLVMKNTREVITVTDRKVFGLNEAKAYYVRMKQLKEEEFDKEEPMFAMGGIASLIK